MPYWITEILPIFHDMPWHDSPSFDQCGFYPNAKKLHRECQQEGYSFRLKDITKWLKHQYNHQIYLQPLPCKAEASFSKIKIPNKVHQCDILLHIHNNHQDGRKVFVCSLLVIDVATHYKEGCSLTSRNSLEIWIAIKKIYENPSNPLIWPILLMTDSDASFWSAELGSTGCTNKILVLVLY